MSCGSGEVALHSQANLHTPDVGKTFEYLTEILGFSPEFRGKSPDGRVVFAGAWWGEPGKGFLVVLGDIEEALHGHYDHGEFGKQMEKHPLGTGVVLYFPTDDVDALYSRVTERGALVDEPPTDQFWGERTISLKTPDGYYMTFAQPIEGFQFPPAFAVRMQSFPTSALPLSRQGSAAREVRRTGVR